MKARHSSRAWVGALLALVAAAPAARAHGGHAGPHPTPGKPATTVFRVRPEARADLGWTGISHGQVWPAEERLGFAVVCRDGDESCAAAGGTAGDFFGSPVPLAAGGIPACVVNRLRAPVAGTVQPKLGCTQLDLHLASTVFLGETLDRPCPTCDGDPTPNDGRRDGHCKGGAADGAACDAQGTTPRLGVVSNDCQPSPGKRTGGALHIDLAPLTTGEAALRAGTPCMAASAKDAARCFCPGQLQANACIGGRCGPDGRCPDGPIDTDCSSGTCVASLRPCFGETLPVAGKCDAAQPTFAAVFCVPATGATALNSAAGLPGPARLVLPLERVNAAAGSAAAR